MTDDRTLLEMAAYSARRAWREFFAPLVWARRAIVRAAAAIGSAM